MCYNYKVKCYLRRTTVRKRLFKKTKKQILPCIGLSMAAGFFSAIIITLFKICTEEVVHLSSSIYATVRATPVWLPALAIGAAAIGFIASLLYSISTSCRGGGIPSSVAAIRGILSFRWWSNLLILPISSLISFFCGLPLGTEGPCVQLGTAIGDGITHCFAKEKHKGWRRYIMTGGASAGFSIATSSPITAIIFSMEELHKHFSPLIMMVASISVMTAQVTVQLFSFIGIEPSVLFHIPAIKELDVKLLFTPLVIGIVCGIGALLFITLYQRTNKLVRALLKKVSVKIVLPILFACVAIIGFFMTESLGSGHSLIENLLTTPSAWYLLVLIFLIRAIVMIISNTAGVTGGVFLPTLSFGALIGALCGKAMIRFEIIEPEYYILMVILGIVAFLGATSHIPVTAAVFALEALGGFNNTLSVIIAVTAAFLIVEAFGMMDFTDTVIESKLRSTKKGKTATIVDVSLTITKNAFAIGKEMRDILLPHACFVVSVERTPEHKGKHELLEGDVISFHYKTYNPSATADELTVIMGEQSEEIRQIIYK